MAERATFNPLANHYTKGIYLIHPDEISLKGETNGMWLFDRIENHFNSKHFVCEKLQFMNEIRIFSFIHSIHSFFLSFVRVSIHLIKVCN